jgi:hypothetical protein
MPAILRENPLKLGTFPIQDEADRMRLFRTISLVGRIKNDIVAQILNSGG